MSGRDSRPSGRPQTKDQAGAGVDKPHGFGTAAVHAGEPRTKEGNALTTPIMQTATYTFADTQELKIATPSSTWR